MSGVVGAGVVGVVMSGVVGAGVVGGGGDVVAGIHVVITIGTNCPANGARGCNALAMAFACCAACATPAAPGMAPPGIVIGSSAPGIGGSTPGDALGSATAPDIGIAAPAACGACVA